MPETPPVFAQRLEQSRLAAGLSKYKLAQALGVNMEWLLGEEQT